MVKINRIYTRTGDDGTTGLVGGTRVKKNSLRVICYGELDELNAFLGWARTIAKKNPKSTLEEPLAILENELFDLGAYLASPPNQPNSLPLTINAADIARLEQWIDKSTEGIPELRSFVLPGGSDLNAALHISRAVCRRVERSMLDLKEQEQVDNLAIKYINRLSDYLFAVSRLAAHEEGAEEFLWKPAEQLKAKK